MAEHIASAAYTSEPTDDELAELDAYIRANLPERTGDHVRGRALCPHCHWLVDYSIDRLYLRVEEEVVRILLACDCGLEHPSHPKDTVNCGFEAMAAIPIPEETR